jgi:hypothetical protein
MIYCQEKLKGAQKSSDTSNFSIKEKGHSFYEKCTWNYILHFLEEQSNQVC